MYTIIGYIHTRAHTHDHKRAHTSTHKHAHTRAQTHANPRAHSHIDSPDQKARGGEKKGTCHASIEYTHKGDSLNSV